MSNANDTRDDKPPAPGAPAWSETPPTEPGGYFVAYPDGRVEVAFVNAAANLIRTPSLQVGLQPLSKRFAGARWQRIVAPQPPQPGEAPAPASVPTKAGSAPARDPFGPVTDDEKALHNEQWRAGKKLYDIMDRMLAARRAAWLAAMPPDVGAMVEEGTRLLRELKEHRRAVHDVKLWALDNLHTLLVLAGSAAADSVRSERAERERDEARENRDAIHAKLTETLARLHRREQREASADPARHLARYRATRAQLRTAQIKLLENHAFKREKFHLNIWRGINEAERAAVAKAKAAEQRVETAEAERDALRARVERLGAALAEALDALDELHDWQNGPPLLKYEKEWRVADQKASAVLRKHGRLPQATDINDNDNLAALLDAAESGGGEPLPAGTGNGTATGSPAAPAARADSPGAAPEDCPYDPLDEAQCRECGDVKTVGECDPASGDTWVCFDCSEQWVMPNPAAPAAPSPGVVEAARAVVKQAEFGIASARQPVRKLAAALAAHDAGTLALAADGTLPVPEGTLIEVALRGRYFLTDQSKRAFIRNGPGDDIFLDSIDYLHPVVRLAAPQSEGGAT